VRLLLEAFHAPLSNPYIIYSPTFSCADDIVIGAFLALLLRTSARRQVLRRAPLVFVLAAVPLLLMGIANHGLSFLTSKLVATVGISLLGIAFTALIAMSLVPASLTQRVFSNPFLRQFGRYSYGIYVFHSSIARFLTRPLRQFFNGHFHSKPFAVLAPVIILTALTFALAVASYHLIEVRFLHLKRFFQYRRPRIS
jgi:peptidoglycan/LPS O-acetylase OafA/YrhL